MRNPRDALGRGVHSNPFAVLGPHDTPDGRSHPRVSSRSRQRSRSLRRSDGAVMPRLEPASESGLFENLVAERRLIGCESLARRGAGDRRPLFFRAAARRRRSAPVQRRPAFRTGATVWARNSDRSTASTASVLPCGHRTPTRVAVVGDFNSWDRRRHAMRMRHSAGIWELFMPRVAPGSHYKYDILGPGGVQLPWKADPGRAPDRNAAQHRIGRAADRRLSLA